MVIHIENKQGEVKMALRKEIQGFVLTDYQISEAMWDGDELVILIAPVPQSCFVARVKDKESIKKAFNVMQEKPNKAFILNDDSIDVSPDKVINITDIKEIKNVHSKAEL